MNPVLPPTLPIPEPGQVRGSRNPVDACHPHGNQGKTGLQVEAKELAGPEPILHKGGHGALESGCPVTVFRRWAAASFTREHLEVTDPFRQAR